MCSSPSAYKKETLRFCGGSLECIDGRSGVLRAQKDHAQQSPFSQSEQVAFLSLTMESL
jgi:hypothetical protein